MQLMEADPGACGLISVIPQDSQYEVAPHSKVCTLSKWQLDNRITDNLTAGYIKYYWILEQFIQTWW
jgi:hypothetical protein